LYNHIFGETVFNVVAASNDKSFDGGREGVFNGFAAEVCGDFTDDASDFRGLQSESKCDVQLYMIHNEPWEVRVTLTPGFIIRMAASLA
jgi:hypothetical protein